MKAFMLFTGSGPLVVLTSHGSITAPGLLEKFAAKGIDASSSPARSGLRPGVAVGIVVIRDPHESGDRRIVGDNGPGDHHAGWLMMPASPDAVE